MSQRKDVMAIIIACCMPDEALPMADCEHCSHRESGKNGGHCYMFKEKPGSRCGQFAAA